MPHHIQGMTDLNILLRDLVKHLALRLEDLSVLLQEVGALHAFAPGDGTHLAHSQPGNMAAERCSYQDGGITVLEGDSGVRSGHDG